MWEIDSIGDAAYLTAVLNAVAMLSGSADMRTLAAIGFSVGFHTQWASEERLFSRIVRPMMTFFEAFLYAVSPLMVFAIGLGPTGIGMVGKYLLFGLWIQLWQPILAIINLYIIMAMKFKMDALQDMALGNTVSAPEA